MGCRQLRHELHLKPHAVEAEQPARRQPAHAAVRDSQVGRNSRQPKLISSRRRPLAVAGDRDKRPDRDDDAGPDPYELAAAELHRRYDVHHDYVDGHGDGWRRRGGRGLAHRVG